MTRFVVLASAALAAGSGLVSAAPAPAPNGRFGHYNVQVANVDWNNADWQGAVSSWLAVRPGIRTASHSHSHSRYHHGQGWHGRTRTRTYPAPTGVATTSVAEATPTEAPEPSVTEAPEPTATEEPASTEAPEPTIEEEPTTVEEPAPEPTEEPETSAPAETSSAAPATSTEEPAPAPTTAAPTTTVAPTTTAAPSDSKAATTTAAPSTGNADIDAYLAGHNNVRANHGAVALTWADDLAAAAQKWASNCVWEHSQGKVGAFGENLAAGTGLGAAAAVKMWTDEVSEYNPANPQYSHFTQVVWKATTEVGCAVASCKGLLTGFSGAVNFHVCEYRKPGNVIGQFAENVQV